MSDLAVSELISAVVRRVQVTELPASHAQGVYGLSIEPTRLPTSRGGSVSQSREVCG